MVLYATGRAILKGLKAPPEQRQRVWNLVRYTLALALAGALVIVWADVLRAAALVAGAVAVAVVIASKELLMCLLGWWVKMTGDAFHIGDRIQVGDVKGDVLDYGLLTTTLLRVGTGHHDEFRSGAVVTVPNSQFLTTSVHNLTHTLNYKWEELEVVLDAKDDWRAAETALLAAATEATEGYRDEARDQTKRMEKTFSFHPIQTDARVFVAPCAENQIRLLLRVPLPVRGARATQDQILRGYLSRLAS